MSTSDLIAFLHGAKWYHAFELDGITTNGRFPSGVQNRTLLGVFDMLNCVSPKGLACLDVGTVDGIVAFGLSRLGANKVVATDRVERATFLRLREHLKLKVDYHSGFEMPQIEQRYNSERFDLVVCAGVVYHMLNPFSAFQICRRLTRTGGLLFLETAADFRNPESATIAVNSEEELFNESYTYFLPTPAAVRGMMKMAGFDVLDERYQRSLRRYAVVGRAAKPGEISNATATLKAMFDKGYVDYGFNLKDSQVTGTTEVEVEYRRIEGRQEMSTEIEESVTFPFHPGSSQPESIGNRHQWDPVSDASP